VDLADAGGGGRLVVELGEPRSPGAAELLAEHRVHGAHRHGRRLLLEFHQGLAIGRRYLLRNRGLEDRQGLAQLHGPALELTQHGEQLLGRPLLQLRGDGVGVAAREPLAQAEGGPAGRPQRERRQTCGPRDRASRHHRSVVTHAFLLAGARAPSGTAVSSR
jgi:hypothetical protein